MGQNEMIHRRVVLRSVMGGTAYDGPICAARTGRVVDTDQKDLTTCGACKELMAPFDDLGPCAPIGAYDPAAAVA